MTINNNTHWFYSSFASHTLFASSLAPCIRMLTNPCLSRPSSQVLKPDLAPPDNAPLYWVACGGMYAYMYGRLTTLRNTTGNSVRVLGASQLMDAPGQEPSVLFCVTFFLFFERLNRNIA
jgi:hypothetical protein